MRRNNCLQFLPLLDNSSLFQPSNDEQSSGVTSPSAVGWQRGGQTFFVGWHDPLSVEIGWHDPLSVETPAQPFVGTGGAAAPPCPP